MKANSFVAMFVLVGTLGAVGITTALLVQRYRAELVERFGEERLDRVEDAARGVIDALDDVEEDLRFTGELIAQPGPVEEHQRELRAFLEAVGQYKAIGVYGESGAARMLLLDRRASPQVREGRYAEAMARFAREALEGSAGAVLTSPALDGAQGGWLRVFAMRVVESSTDTKWAVAVLVDTEPLFAPLRLALREPHARLLLLGVHGLPVPASDTVLRLAALEPRGADALPAFGRLLAGMRRRERGVVRLPEEEATTLGLPGAEAVAAFLPIQPREGMPWFAAAVVSTAELRSVERGLVARLTFAAGGVSAFLALFGVYVVLASRRAVALAESQRLAARLAHLRDKTQKILDSVPTGVLAVNAAGEVTALNRPLREALPNGGRGTTFEEVFARAEPAARTRLRELVEASVATGCGQGFGSESLQLFGKPGAYRIQAVPLEAPDAEVQALLLVEDLSRLRALESQLLRAEKLAMVGVLAAGIAHEIGTPLGVVRGIAEYAVRKLGGERAEALGLETIVGQIDRVSRTILQLLDFARLKQAHVQPVALSSVLQRVRELLRLELERYQVTLSTNLMEPLPMLAADPDQLEQVLVNLLLNAIHASKKAGSVRLSARAVCSASGARSDMVFRVEDEGSGIAPEHLHQVFDPFFTTKKRGQGTGLGLAVVDQVVRNHGGSLELESTVGKGTTISITWPGAPPAPDADLRGAS